MKHRVSLIKLVLFKSKIECISRKRTIYILKNKERVCGDANLNFLRIVFLCFSLGVNNHRDQYLQFMIQLSSHNR